MSPSDSHSVTNWPSRLVSRVFSVKSRSSCCAGGAEIAGGGVSLSDAHRHLASLVGLAPFALQPLDEPVELVVLEVKLRDPLDDAELAFEFVGLLERPPQQFDRLALPDSFAEGVGECDQPLWIGRIRADRAAEGVEPFFLIAELEAEIGEELVDLGIAGRRREQVAAGLKCLLAAAESLFQFGDSLQILGAEAAVERGQLAVRVGGGEHVPGGLVNPRRRDQHRNRLRVFLARLGDRLGRLVALTIGLEEPSQSQPPVGGRVFSGGQFLCERRRSVRRASPSPGKP